MSPLKFAAVSAESTTADSLARFCEKLGRATGLSVQPRLLGSYAELKAGTLAGELDVVWAPPLVAIDLEDEAAAQSVVVVHRSARAGYYSALFARTESRFTRPEDLRGARAAWVSKDSASGYFVPRWHLRSMGIRLAEAFASEALLGTHEAVTRAVLGDTADVGATHVALDPVTGNLASAPWLAQGVAPSAVRVLLLVGPIPGDVIAVSQRVDAASRRQLVAALVAMKEDESSRNLFEAGQFDPVPEGHLDLLRRLARFRETKA
ncbi:MAG: phosphate/phosphite/phosphonate ABC transporter substrate-binding protein [Myxococcales bacterium]|nr:phosphate/phosphite/phosphonate ABC transporter substrate-binding protein [Myxococcales bacterium]